MACMRSTSFVLLFCLGLLTAGCDNKPKPGVPVPKAATVSSTVAPQH